MLQMIMNGDEPTANQICDQALHPDLEPADMPCQSIGSAPYTLDLAVWSTVEATDFISGIETIVRSAVDTDTNGAICEAVPAPDSASPPS